jgi:hypothetical protein
MSNRRDFRPSKVSMIAAVALLVIAGASFGAAIAGSSPASTVIHACAASGTGALRLVDGADRCTARETSVSWNQDGPAGPRGPVGPRGLMGERGPAGALGQTGPATDWVAPFAALKVKGIYGFAAAQIVVFNPNPSRALVWIRVYDTPPPKYEYQNCQKIVAPGRVSPACMFYNGSGWAYVHSNEPVIPYGLAFTKSLSPGKKAPAADTGGAAALEHILMPAPLDWYPFCPRVVLLKPSCQD